MPKGMPFFFFLFLLFRKYIYEYICLKYMFTSSLYNNWELHISTLPFILSLEHFTDHNCCTSSSIFIKKNTLELIWFVLLYCRLKMMNSAVLFLSSLVRWFVTSPPSSLTMIVCVCLCHLPHGFSFPDLSVFSLL